MNESYSALGSWFEYLNDDCDYDKWSQYLVEKLSSAGAGPNGCDVGCGNGYFTRALYRAGYRMTGVDISPQMLSVAKTKAAKEGVNAEFLLGDITKLNLRPKTDFITAVNDCLNYVPPEKLQSCFKRVYSCLNRGGVFLFDVSSGQKLKNVLGNNVFCEDREKLSYMWFNSYKDGKSVMDLTFFIRRADGLYERADERHVQYAHGEEAIKSSLAAAGFCDVSSEGFLGGEDRSQRIHFIGKKI